MPPLETGSGRGRGFAGATVLLMALVDLVFWGAVGGKQAEDMSSLVQLHAALHIAALGLTWLGAAIACTVLKHRLPGYRMMALAALVFVCMMFFVLVYLFNAGGLALAAAGQLCGALLFAGAACLVVGRRR